jgi:hypothetical protein
MVFELCQVQNGWLRFAALAGYAIPANTIASAKNRRRWPVAVHGRDYKTRRRLCRVTGKVLPGNTCLAHPSGEKCTGKRIHTFA